LSETNPPRIGFTRVSMRDLKNERKPTRSDKDTAFIRHPKNTTTMKHLILTGLALVAFTIVAPIPSSLAQNAAAPAAPALDPAKQLQGAWEGVEKGREDLGKCTLTITDKGIHFQGANPQEWYKGTFTLPAGTDPQQLIGTIAECGHPDFVGKNAISIYKIDGDTLTIAGKHPGSPDAPKTLDGEEGTRTFILKKVQK
jgi:uncharacterized protein (TIGR03067 family)